MKKIKIYRIISTNFSSAERADWWASKEAHLKGYIIVSQKGGLYGLDFFVAKHLGGRK